MTEKETGDNKHKLLHFPLLFAQKNAETHLIGRFVFSTSITFCF